MAETTPTDGNDASLDDSHLVMVEPTTNADTSMMSSSSSSKGAGVTATSLGSGQASPFHNNITTTTRTNEPTIPTTPTTTDIGNFISSIVANLNNSSGSKATAGSSINNSTIPSVSYPGMMMTMTRTTTNDNNNDNNNNNNNSFAAEAAAGAPTHTKGDSDIIINTSNFDMTMMSPMSPSITSVSSPMVTNNSVYMSNSLISNNNNINIIQEEDLDNGNITMDAHTEEQEKEDADDAEFVEVMIEEKPEKKNKNIAVNHDSSDEESELTGESYNDNNVTPVTTNDDKMIYPIISASGSGTGGTYNSESIGNYNEKGTMTSFINSDSGTTDRHNGATTKRCRPVWTVWWLWCLAILVLVLAAVVAVIVVLDHRNSSSSTTTSSGAASKENASNTNIASLAPTVAPTNSPSMTPTTSSSSSPTQSPSIVPTNQSSSSPTFAPTLAPTVTAMPSDSPSDTPSDVPSDVPSIAPTFPPSIGPSDAPSDIPTLVPTGSPSIWPSDPPSDIPSLTPTGQPSISPTTAPTVTAAPTVSPAPTAATHSMLADVLGNSRQGVTPMEVLQDPTTPQGRAVMWMATEDTVIMDILESSSTTAATATDADGGVTVTSVVVVSANNSTANVTQPTVSELTPTGHMTNPFFESSEKLQQRFAVVALDMALHDGMDIVWSFPDLHECEWPGIKCNSDQEITGINWARQDLSGYVAPELALLTNLERLDLAENQLSGFVDVFWTVPSLEKLYLFSNQFMGSIGTEIGRMSNLEHLYLSKNELTGNIPESLFDELDSLRYLILSFNQFEGLPDRIRMRNLYYFDLSFNNLGGTLPANLNMPKLKHFHMDHNDFTGTIPGEYSNLGSNRLLQFYLNDNNLVGGFPSGWQKNLPHKFLTNVDVSNNELTQKIPGSVCVLSVYDEGETVEFRADCNICDCNRLCYQWCSGEK